MPLQQSKTPDEIAEANRKQPLDLSLYPIDMSSFLVLPNCTFDSVGVPFHLKLAVYHPNTVVQYALAHLNEYLATDDQYHRDVFLAQANWLVMHAVHIGEDASGWPISFPHPDVSGSGSWISAFTQGNAISVLMRAYQLTHMESFLEVAQRAIRTFERDILDGGVCTPIGAEGVFFEEVAAYPATHSLNGFMFALLGLYDYVALKDDVHIEQLLNQSFATMHKLLLEFDAGFWVYSDLLHRHLAPPSQLALQIELLEALATCSDSETCRIVAARWDKYQCRFTSRLRYRISSRCAKFSHTLWSGVRTRLFPPFSISPLLEVCVAVSAFPVLGGIRTVLASIAQVTTDKWHIEYLTKVVGQEKEGHIIHQFGATKGSIWHSAWQFPFVWLYVLAGWWKLVGLLRRGAGYRVILPQDGVFTAAFTSLAAKLAGVRVICIDHGSLTLMKSSHYHAERLQSLAERKWPVRLLGRFLYSLYWPSLYLLARIAARFVDQYLIPGVTGDGVEEICQYLGIPPSRLTRFGSMVDIDRHYILDAPSRATIREKYNIAADGIVIAIICRLMPEKGVDIALESISQAIALLSPEVRAQVHIIIAGDGPLRQQVEEDIHTLRLHQKCVLWGNIAAEDVLSLLAISDIFLNTTTRGTCLPMSILEAMASGCAVIATNEPLANEYMLAEGRGIVTPPGNVRLTSEALVLLMNNAELRHQMGDLSRNYIKQHHSPDKFRRTLMRVTYWSVLDEIIHIDKEIESVGKSNS